ncbi:hypothetical protein [Limnohabitans sp.]|jgi:hypothetical protein
MLRYKSVQFWPYDREYAFIDSGSEAFERKKPPEGGLEQVVS